jgi:hypothetical protein
MFLIKKTLVIFFIFFFMPSGLFAFKSVGLGFGPAFNLRGGMSTAYFFTGEWTPHKNLGGKLFLGFVNGFWIGTALNTTFSVYETKTKGFDWSINFSIPFIININNGIKTAFIGLGLGNSLSFALDSRSAYYLFINPLEFVFIPVTWGLSPGSGFNKGFDVSLAFSLGFRTRI